MDKEILKDGCRRGDSMEYDKEMNLVAVNGVKVNKNEEKKVAATIKTGNQSTLKGGKDK